MKRELLEEATRKRRSSIDHIEDIIIDEGLEGFELLKKAFSGAVKFCDGEKTDVNISVKYDGSPAVFFYSGEKPWVATKSLFNKEPKINYTPEDINRNHESPGLNKKLNIALRFLPKLKMSGIVQGDILFTEDDVKPLVINREKYLTFKANTITYGVKVGTQLSQKVSVAKIGIALHTTYSGPSPKELVPSYKPILKYSSTPEVFVLSPYDVQRTPFSDEDKRAIESIGTFSIKPVIFDIIREKKSSDLFKKYINQRIKTNSIDVSAENLANGLLQFFEVNDNRTLAHIKEDVVSLCDIYLRLIKIKEIILKHLSGTNELKTFIKDGESLIPSNGEGYVLVVDNTPLKLVRRMEFSRANFTLPKEWDTETN